jgi:curved DNA-binding protein CbpA
MAEELIALVQVTSDYYEILEVGRKATDKEIKTSYRKKALLLHPDRCSLAGATDAFQKLSNAHMCLSDPAKRRQYDLSGSDTPAPANPFGGGGNPVGGGNPFGGGGDPFAGFNFAEGFPGFSNARGSGFTFHTTAYPSNRARKRHQSKGTRRQTPDGGGDMNPDVLQYILRAARMAQEAQANGTHRDGTDYFAAAGYPASGARGGGGHVRAGAPGPSVTGDVPGGVRNSSLYRFWTALIGEGVGGQVATYVVIVGIMMLCTALLMNHAAPFIFFVFVAGSLGE